MLKSDKYLINDFPVFYDTKAFAKNIIFTGPLYAKIGEGQINDKKILDILSPENKRLKVFCTLGSSRNKSDLLEIIKVFNKGKGKDWSGIILSPEAICPIDEARNILNNNNVYITDKFVPAKEINKKVDLEFARRTRNITNSYNKRHTIGGVATQPEQKNKSWEHLEKFGMALEYPKGKWEK